MSDETKKLGTAGLGWLVVVLLASIAGTVAHILGAALWVAVLTTSAIVLVGWLVLRRV